MPDVGDALSREEAWYLAAVPGLRPLDVATGGPFDIVAANVRRIAQHPRQLFLGLLTATSVRTSKTGDLRHDYEISALVLWGHRVSGAGARAHVELGALDEALGRIVERVIAGGDITHGGRWWRTTPPVVEFPPPATILAFADVIGAADPAHVRSVRYTCSEYR